MGVDGRVGSSASPFDAETDRQIAADVGSLREARGIRSMAWESLSLLKRLAVLQDVEDRMAAIQARPTVMVIADGDMEPGEFGAFDGERIRVNRRQLRGEMPVSELVNTVIHEGRHAYQQYAVESTGVVADASVVAAWADNLDNYMDATIFGQELYETQPIEADAWSYAARICQALYDDP